MAMSNILKHWGITNKSTGSKHPDGRMNKHGSNMNNSGDRGVDEAEETSVI